MLRDYSKLAMKKDSLKKKIQLCTNLTEEEYSIFSKMVILSVSMSKSEAIRKAIAHYYKFLMSKKQKEE